MQGTLCDLILNEDVGALDEVVVTGYTTQKKVSVLGAQSTLKMEHVKAPVSNLSSIFAGRIPGVVSVQRTGVPGQDDSDIWIRGISTMTNTNEGPLVLVDGIERSFSQLDPEDIESVTVLKDAASTAVYGVRGGNGVIIITTKPGKVSKPQFSFDLYQVSHSLPRCPTWLTALPICRLLTRLTIIPMESTTTRSSISTAHVWPMAWLPPTSRPKSMLP